MIGAILLQIILIALNAVFACAEIAVVSMSSARLRQLSDEGDRRAQRLGSLTAVPARFLATIQVAITLVGFFSSAVASTNLSDPFAQWMSSFGIGWLTAVAPVLSPILITLAVSYFSIVLGELVPKRIALADTEKVAKMVSGPLIVFGKIASPLVWLTSASANLVASVFRIKQADEGQVSEEEIKYMVTDSEELSDQEKSMIHDVIDLGDTIAREVMIPRVDMTSVEDTSTLNHVLAVMRRTGYSRIPVYHDSVDRVIGIAHIKDIIRPILDEGKGEARVADFVRTATYVPDTKDIIPLLSEMQTSHEQMVIVVDEYGGTAGVLTIEDIVEEIVGEIEDEFDPDNKYLTKLSEREWLVDGRFSLDDAMDLGWPIEDNEEFETIAGYVLELADKVPHPGDVFEKDGYTFRVQSMRGRRVSLLRVSAPEPAEEPDEPTAKGDGDKDAATDKE